MGYCGLHRWHLPLLLQCGGLPGLLASWAGRLRLAWRGAQTAAAAEYMQLHLGHITILPLMHTSHTLLATCLPLVLQQLEALGHLRRLQLWRNLTLHAYHSAEDFARQQQQTTVRQFMQLMHLMQKASVVCPVTCWVCLCSALHAGATASQHGMR